MNIAKQLEKEIAQSFHMKKVPTENESMWIKRVIYSSIARNAYASLWDIQEDDPSITHFKSRTKEIFSALEAVYPKYLNSLDEEVITRLLENIYQVYLKSGQFYHSPNRIKYSKKLVCCCDGISLIRSPQPYDEVFMSGAGFYIKEKEESNVSIYELFDISPKKLSEFYDFLSCMKFVYSAQFEGKVQYLRLNNLFSKGYWKYEPDIDDNISLMRIGYPGSELYYLYRYEDDTLMVHQLPDWMVKNQNYLDIACSLLHEYKTLPPVQFVAFDELVFVKLNYLLPPKLQTFFELYSWPYSYNDDSKFKRMMNRSVFGVFKSLLEELEFEFKEGK